MTNNPKTATILKILKNNVRVKAFYLNHKISKNDFKKYRYFELRVNVEKHFTFIPACDLG